MESRLHVALLRGINVGGHHSIPMPDLRLLAGELGWTGVESYIQSGNLLFRAGEAPVALEQLLERAIERRFGFRIPVIVRPGALWLAHLRGNPFPEASREEPNRVMLALSRSAPVPGAAALQDRASSEKIAEVDGALWIHFTEGSGHSKLTPALRDRLVGSPVTTRNWRTVVELGAMLERAGGRPAPS